ncbi:beta-N-acetylhexosaminidase [Paenibacillus sp. sgz302251]|uniref:beta-N-acetylhexosaminidase n=1 Tax=Paenibacillus sp. sgz302251 TaxID=3414493 RepID=UPI003C7DEE3F
MQKTLTLLLTFLMLGALLISCGKDASSGNMQPSPQPIEVPEPNDPIKDRIAEMSIDEKIGQMLLVGLEGTTVNSESRMLIEDKHIGGFILYKDNMTDSSQIAALLNELKDANRVNKAPLWLSVDQEGGKVNRLPEQYAKLPTAEQIGRMNNSEYSFQIGAVIGEALHSLGFNMNFAPVLDINSNPLNPVIGNRAFGDTPQRVIQHGMETMKGLQSKQVAAVVKHFPGHGDTSIDSHLDLPVVKKSISELENFELLPFKEAIKQHTDAIMIAHLLIPKLDEKYPASLSKKIMTDLLRNTLQYEGVIITDDMTMGGITEHFDIGEAAVRSVQAGSDILLIGHDYDLQMTVIKALKKSVDEGVLTEDMLNKSVYRILRLKEKYKLQDTPVNHVDVQAVNRQIEAALKLAKSK